MIEGCGGGRMKGWEEKGDGLEANELQAPVQESFRRAREKQRDDSSGNRATSQERYGGDHFDGETTFMFVLRIPPRLEVYP